MKDGWVMDKMQIGGIMQSDGRSLIKILSVPDHASVVATLLEAMAGRASTSNSWPRALAWMTMETRLVIDQKDSSGSEDPGRHQAHPRCQVISYTPDCGRDHGVRPPSREKAPHPWAGCFLHGLSGHWPLWHQHVLSSVSCVIKGEDVETVLRPFGDFRDFPTRVKTRPKDY